MNDPVYYEKYRHGADKTDLLGKAKQAIDARHTSGIRGLYVSGGSQVHPDNGDTLGAGEIGLESYYQNWITVRGSFAGAIGPNESIGGLDIGVRAQTPTRFAPFFGIGAFTGWHDRTVSANDDWIDNDDDMFVDEPDETRTVTEGWIAAVYPESCLSMGIVNPELRREPGHRAFVKSVTAAARS